MFDVYVEPKGIEGVNTICFNVTIYDRYNLVNKNESGTIMYLITSKQTLNTNSIQVNQSCK